MPKITTLRDPYCTLCALYKSTQYVCIFGKGYANSEVFLVGEAPGAEEEKQGLPFVGRSGRLLDRILEETGVNKYRVYITNVVKCRPEFNNTPEQKEIIVCSSNYLEKEIYYSRPKVLVLLGKTAVRWMGIDWKHNLGRGTKVVRDFYEGSVIVTYHPSYILRNITSTKLFNTYLKHFQLIISYMQFHSKIK